MTDLLRSALPSRSDSQLQDAVKREWIVKQAKDGLAEARRAPSYATVNLARWFRKNRSLGSRDRRVVAELIHGVVRHEAILLRAGARSPEDLIVAVADVFAGERFATLSLHSPAEDFATALNVPGKVATEWLNVLGSEKAAAYAASINHRPPVDIRVNHLKTSRDELKAALNAEGVNTQATSSIQTHLEVVGRANLTQTQAFKQGLFEVQDRSSQAFVEALPLGRGDRVLDLCAGAGGKSLALAARGARVTATDIRSHALQELQKRAVRAGATIVIEEPEPAPLVVVDAPCSGSGRLRRNPMLRWGLTDGEHLEVQVQLLEAAAELVLPGGHLVYATCSLFERENQHSSPMGFEVVNEKTLWPHRDESDGFYWRVMRRV